LAPNTVENAEPSRTVENYVLKLAIPTGVPREVMEQYEKLVEHAKSEAGVKSKGDVRVTLVPIEG
jgi:hypothetical protein